jgi:hypothetical protein
VVDGEPRARRNGTTTPVRVLEIDPDEQDTIVRARALSAGGLSVRKTIAALAHEGRLNRASNPFTVRAMWERARALP